VQLIFPVVGGSRRDWTLTAAKLAEYQASYPGVDVLAECRAALQWCRDNARKRKTARGMPAFLARWLAKEQNRAAAGPAAEHGNGRGNRETAAERFERVKTTRQERSRAQ
jgi:hypothetical protein